jgi:hypothetical protein
MVKKTTNPSPLPPLPPPTAFDEAMAGASIEKVHFVLHDIIKEEGPIGGVTEKDLDDLWKKHKELFFQTVVLAFWDGFRHAQYAAGLAEEERTLVPTKDSSNGSSMYG